MLGQFDENFSLQDRLRIQRQNGIGISPKIVRVYLPYFVATVSSHFTTRNIKANIRVAFVDVLPSSIISELIPF